MLFRNRTEAGRALAQALAEYRDQDAVVFALPRGGVTLGKEVAQALRVPLDVVIARKVGHPFNPEYAICALSESGRLVCNEEERAQVDERWFTEAVERERREAERRRERYLAGRSPTPLEGKIAILVDDGIATGLTMFAAIEEIRSRHPRQVVVAIPVIPQETAARLRAAVDRVVALEIPTLFLGAVGAYYEDFSQVSDEEVIRLLREDPAVLFAVAPYREYADKLLELPELYPGHFSPSRFPNGELHLSLGTPVTGALGVVLGALTPPDDHLLTTCLLAHTLKKDGAGKVVALCPYLAYMRQDRNEPGRSRATPWVGALLQASGIDLVVTADIHSRQAMDQLPMPVISISPAPVFAAEIVAQSLTDATLVAPDEGSIPRCDAVREVAQITAPLAYMEKQRTPEGIQVTLHGEVGKRAVVIDDMLDTGATLIACCAALRQAGCEEIVIMVTHGLFTGDVWQRLWEEGVTRIYCTDTVPLPDAARYAGVQVLPALSLFLPVLQAEIGVA